MDNFYTKGCQNIKIYPIVMRITYRGKEYEEFTLTYKEGTVYKVEIIRKTLGNIHTDPEKVEIESELKDHKF